MKAEVEIGFGRGLPQVDLLPGGAEYGDGDDDRAGQRLGASISSCSGMVRRLAELGLVEHARYGDIELTDSGSRIAMEMVRRHRLVEALLTFLWVPVHDR